MTFITGCPEAKSVSVLLRGGQSMLLMRLEERLMMQLEWCQLLGKMAPF